MSPQEQAIQRALAGELNPRPLHFEEEITVRPEAPGPVLPPVATSQWLGEEPDLATTRKGLRIPGTVGTRQTPIPWKDSYHPEGASEGIAERLIKYFTKRQNYLPADQIYLEQYLHPEHDIIPKQPLRPTQLSKLPDMEFRRVPQMVRRPPFDFRNVEGLGQYTQSETPEYESVYDVWDFDTTGNLFRGSKDFSRLDPLKNWAAKKFLQWAGTPFAVYERYPSPGGD